MTGAARRLGVVLLAGGVCLLAGAGRAQDAVGEPYAAPRLGTRGEAPADGVDVAAIAPVRPGAVCAGVPDAGDRVAVACCDASEAHRVLDLERAAPAYALCATLAPADPRAAGALRTAVVLWQALGESARARQAAESFERLYGRRAPEEAGELLLAVAPDVARLAGPRAERAHVRALASRFAGYPRLAVRALAREGVLAAEAGDARAAAGAFEAAAAAWAGLTERERTTAGGAVRRAAARATFERVEVARAAHAASAPPVARGVRTSHDFQRWAARTLVPWLSGSSRRLTELVSRYEAVARIGVPEWTVAAAFRVAELRVGMRDSVLALPRPPELDEQLYRDVYLPSVEEVTVPWLEQARAALDHALLTARRGHVWNVWAERAAALRARIDGEETVDVRLGELVPAVGAPGEPTFAERLPDWAR